MPTGRYKSSLIPRRMPTCAPEGRHSRSEMKTPGNGEFTSHICAYKVCQCQCTRGVGVGVAIQISGDPSKLLINQKPYHTFLIMGSTASVLLGGVEAAPASEPFGRCESGTRMGLCLRIDFFF